MAVLRLFGPARLAAGTDRSTIGGATVADVLGEACDRYGSSFADVLGQSRVWVNGAPASAEDPVGDADEVAVLPPVSGG